MRQVPVAGTDELRHEVSALRAHVAELQRRLARQEGAVSRLGGLEVSISEREELLVHAERIAHMGSWFWDVTSNTVSWSDELYRILGFEPEACPASIEGFFASVHPDDRARVRAESASAVASGHIPPSLLRIQQPDGAVRHVQADGAALFDGAGKLERLVGTILDITDMTLLQRRLAQAEKMETIGRLAGGIAHDFNNLMTVLNSGAELLATRDPSDLEIISTMKAALTSARDLTSRVLAFGRQSTLRPRLVDPNDVVRDTVRLVTRILGEHVNVEVQLAADVPAAMLDRNLIGQALINLLINARDAMPGGGRIVLSTRRIEGPSGPLVELGVRDDGPGIAADLRDKVFEPFFTTKHEGHGTGLGLAMVQGAVEQQGGSIGFESSAEGTMFLLRFPAAEAADGSGGADGEAEVKRGDRRLKILVVEDHESLAYMVRRLLQRAGHEVWLCTLPSAALTVFRQNAGEVDLVLTDLLMPEMSGLEMIRRFQAIAPLPRILFMSGYGAEAARTLDRDQVLLPKPFTNDELLGAVERALNVNPDVTDT